MELLATLNVLLQDQRKMPLHALNTDTMTTLVTMALPIHQRSRDMQENVSSLL